MKTMMIGKYFKRSGNMRQKQNNVSMFFIYLALAIMFVSLSASGFKMRDTQQDLISVQQELVEVKQENKALNADLKQYGAEKLEKSNVIQMQNATKEGLIWQLQTGGSQDE